MYRNFGAEHRSHQRNDSIPTNTLPNMGAGETCVCLQVATQHRAKASRTVRSCVAAGHSCCVIGHTRYMVIMNTSAPRSFLCCTPRCR